MAPMSRSDLMAYLKDLNIETSTIHHPPLYTVEDSKALRGQLDGGHTKNLFLKDKKDRFYLLVVDEDASIDMKTMHKRLDSARLSFANADYLMEKLGVVPGSVTAFSIFNDKNHDVRIIFDADLMENSIINCHPLVNDATTSINRDDLIRFVQSTGHKIEIMDLTSPIAQETG